MIKGSVDFADFQKLDCRIGKVKQADMVEGSTNLIKLFVDLGIEFGDRQIITGIAKWYTPKDLINKKFIFVVNLEPKKMMNIESQGMILCADTGTKAVLIPVNKKIPVGTLVR